MILISILTKPTYLNFPIFFEYKNRIEKHILLYETSSLDSRKVKDIYFAQKAFLVNYRTNKKNKLNCKVSYIGINLEDLNNFCTELLNDIPVNKVFINLPETLTSFSFILSNEFMKRGANTIIYDKFNNNYTIHNNRKSMIKSLTSIISIENHLLLKGYKILSYTKKDELIKRKKNILEITKNLTQFKEFSNNYKKTDSSKGFYRKLVQEIGKKDEHFIKGGIFEEYIYWLIKDNFKLDDIMLGVTVEFEKNVYNEFDIMFMKDNHLNFIECKFTDNFKTLDYIYKLETLNKFIDDDGKAMILSIGDTEISSFNLKRSNLMKINIFNVQRFLKKKFLKEVEIIFNLKRITS